MLRECAAQSSDLTFITCSDLRQIPDTQEVFLAPDSYNSIILEILQSVPPSDPRDAARYVSRFILLIRLYRT